MLAGRYAGTTEACRPGFEMPRTCNEKARSQGCLQPFPRVVRQPDEPRAERRSWMGPGSANPRGQSLAPEERKNVRYFQKRCLTSLEGRYNPDFGVDGWFRIVIQKVVFPGQDDRALKTPFGLLLAGGRSDESDLPPPALGRPTIMDEKDPRNAR